MSSGHSELTPPLFLLAMPQVADPFFHHSVVLLVHHDDQGSIGFIVNRRTGSRVAEVLGGMGITWGGGPEHQVYFGGPVHPHLGTVIYDGEQIRIEPSPEGGMGFGGFEGVKFTRHRDDLTRLAERPPQSIRLLLGWAGWGPGQLVQEILRNDWLTSPPRKDLIFAADPERVWDAALHSLGIDPAALPSWMPGADEGPVS